MLYNPEHDLYQLLAVSPAAGEDEVRARIESLRGSLEGSDLDEAEGILLNLDSRTRYNSERATHRMRLMLRESLPVFSGRTPIWSVPTSWPGED